MPGGKVIYALIDRRNNQVLRHANGRAAVYSSMEVAARNINNWTSRDGKASKLATIVELEVTKDFRFYRKGV